MENRIENDTQYTNQECITQGENKHHRIITIKNKVKQHRRVHRMHIKSKKKNQHFKRHVPKCEAKCKKSFVPVSGK